MSIQKNAILLLVRLIKKIYIEDIEDIEDIRDIEERIYDIPLYEKIEMEVGIWLSDRKMIYDHIQFYKGNITTVEYSHNPELWKDILYILVKFF